MTLIYVIFTLQAIAIGVLTWRVAQVEGKMRRMGYSVNSSLGIALAVTLDAQVAKLNKMKRKAKELIRQEQYEEAMELKKDILKLAEYIQNAVDSYNEHAGELRIGFNEEKETE
jgi:hypothetical protein